MKIVCISDTHTKQNRMKHPIPDGDVIVHAGDFMNSGYGKRDYLDFIQWFQRLPHPYKIFIAGNHDRYVQTYNKDFRDDVKAFNDENFIYLQDEECVIDGVKFYGSPWQRWFWDWAFNFPNHNYNPAKAKAHAEACWAQIPLDTNVLITHGQPFCINDRAPNGDYTGCPELADRIDKLKELKLYVGGHIHCAYGIKESDGVTYVNASICTEEYSPDNAPIIIEI